MKETKKGATSGVTLFGESGGAKSPSISPNVGLMTPIKQATQPVGRVDASACIQYYTVCMHPPQDMTIPHTTIGFPLFSCGVTDTTTGAQRALFIDQTKLHTVQIRIPRCRDCSVCVLRGVCLVALIVTVMVVLADNRTPLSFNRHGIIGLCMHARRFYYCIFPT